VTTYYPQTPEEMQWLEIHERERAMVNYDWRGALEMLIDRMRSDHARYSSWPGAGFDTVSATTVDEWAQELEEIIKSAASEAMNGE
jgi:hypothetical protein